MKNIVKAFIVGSSWPAFVLFFMGFYSYQGNYNKNNCIEGLLGSDPYYFYTITAPVYMGVMSAVAVYISQLYEISIKKAFIIISILSALIVSIAITFCDIYKFDRQRLTEQYFRLIFYHAILYVVIIATLYEFIE